MPRARNIKPGFFANEVLAALPPHTRLLFIGLWTLADRDGRLEDRPKRIKAALFPYEDVDVDAALDDLARGGEDAFIVRYLTESVRAIQILMWGKHQRPHHQEKPSGIPPPDGLSEQVANSVRTNRPDTLFLDSLLSDSLFPSKPAPGSELVEGSRWTRWGFVLQAPQDAKPSDRCWVLPAEHFLSYGSTFGREFVNQELAKAQAWLVANPRNRKTANGMLRFLYGWLERSNNSRRSPPGSGKPQSQRNTEVLDRIIQEEADGDHH